MKYDDASWRYGGSFPDCQFDEYGGTHIGLFLEWCFVQGWVGALHTEDVPEDVAGVVVGSRSGTDFLFKHCDSKFTDEDLNEQGNAFANLYYGDSGLYLEDYAEQFGELMLRQRALTTSRRST